MCLCICLLHPQPHAGTFTTPGQHFPEVASQVRYSFRWLLWRSPSQGSIQRCLYTLVSTHKHQHPRALFSSSASPRPCPTLTSVEDLTLNSTLLSPQTTAWRTLYLFLSKSKFILPQNLSHISVLHQLAQLNSYIHACSLSLLPVQENYICAKCRLS